MAKGGVGGRESLGSVEGFMVWQVIVAKASGSPNRRIVLECEVLRIWSFGLGHGALGLGRFMFCECDGVWSS